MVNWIINIRMKMGIRIIRLSVSNSWMILLEKDKNIVISWITNIRLDSEL